MSTIRSKNTRPELALRSALYSKGHRFRIHYGENQIDIAFVSRRVAVFVDGCFWQGCPLHFRAPRSNVRYWKRKIFGNRSRDLATSASLKSAGWVVVRVWEHALIEGQISKTVARIERSLVAPRGEARFKRTKNKIN